MSAPRIALVTCAPGRSRDDDLPPLVAALEAAGAVVDAPDWDDESVDWSGYDLAVIRSTWDYTTRHDEFLAWTRRCAAATRLLNPPEVVAWSSDKRYLDDLAALDVAVVPTRFVTDAAAFDPERDLPGDAEYVVKPTVSAGSANTVRHHAGDRTSGAAHVREILALGKVAMVQPYQAAVDDEGETALLYFGGVLSHSIGKGPLLEAGRPAHRALFAEEHITRTTPEPDAEALGDRCLAALARVPALAGIDHPPAYARIDVLRGNDGRWAVLEVELVEPSLFFEWSDGGAERFAAVLVGLAAV